MGKCKRCGDWCYDKYDYCYDCWLELFFDEDLVEDEDIKETAEDDESVTESKVIAICAISGEKITSNDEFYSLNVKKSSSENGKIVPEYHMKVLKKYFDVIYDGQCRFKLFHDNDEVEVRDKYEAKFRAEDGHLVRSTHEMLIDNYLFNHNIRHVYEKIVYSKINDDQCTCDWYLPDYDIYIEYWGMSTQKYLDEKKYKINIYNSNNLNLLSIEKEDLYNKLDDKISKFLYKKKA